MTITRIYIDNCAWDVLFECGVDLCSEFKEDQFELCVTKEVSDFEMPGAFMNKPGLREYFKTCRECVKETSLFGFSSYLDGAEYKSRTSGLGSTGELLTYETGGSYLLFPAKIQSNKRNSGLYKDEADASMAALACNGAIVVTNDSGGPLKRAKENYGARVVFIDRLILGTTSLRDLVVAEINRKPTVRSNP